MCPLQRQRRIAASALNTSALTATKLLGNSWLWIVHARMYVVNVASFQQGIELPTLKRQNVWVCMCLCLSLCLSLSPSAKREASLVQLPELRLEEGQVLIPAHGESDEAEGHPLDDVPIAGGPFLCRVGRGGVHFG